MQKDSKTLPRMTLRSDSYVPALPPKPTMESLAYSKHLALAPYSALRGVVSNARPPERFIETPRCRVRNQVGLTNRWRIPDPLYSDLLGSSQALKAVQSPFNQTLVSIITGKGSLSIPNKTQIKK